MTINIQSEPFYFDQICGYVNKNNLTKWTVEADGHSIKFLSRSVSSNKPLIIGFHGWLNNQHFSFYDLNTTDLDEASLIFPQDRCGFLRAGSWFLGDLTAEAKYTYPALIKHFIQYFVQEFKPSKVIAFGSSMGGFGAWSLSTFFDLDEVYLCVPQTTLSPKAHYFNRDAKCYSKTSGQYSKYLKALGISNYKDFKRLLLNYPFIDAAYFSMLMHASRNAKFYTNDFSGIEMSYGFSKYYHLITTRYDQHQDVNGTYFRDMSLPLINILSKHNISFSSAIFPFSGHDAYVFPQQILAYTNNALREVIANKSQNNIPAHARLRSPPYWKPLLIS